MIIFPILYKKTSTGAIQQWSIRVEGSEIITQFGQVNGAIQTAVDRVHSGKNIGKKNETTAHEQAVLDAQGHFDKKRKKHYVPDYNDALNSVVDTSIIEGGVVPMLAQSYSKHAGKIKFPAAVQPKLDGHRCIAVIEDGIATLWTRTQKPITGVPHINAALEAMSLPDMILDGELYNHDYRNKFEELTSFIRNQNPKLGHEAVQYHVYDIADDPRGFQDRFYETYMLTEHTYDYELNVTGENEFVKVVETRYVNSEDEMMDVFHEFLEEGYEGLMVRNIDSRYVNKRSYDLQKVKEFDDAEFPIVGVQQGRGKMAGKAIFICQTKSGEMFNVKMVGSIDALAQYFDRPELTIGRWLTVKFQGMTSANGVPRFPIGMRFREDV